jgi:undecaprenyl-diphosphatase
VPPWLESGRISTLELDQRGARYLHRGAAAMPLAWLLGLCSQLGNGTGWVLLLGLLPLLDPARGAANARAMLVVGGLNLAIYLALKRATRRPRPFEQCQDIRACVPAADRFSFPSGHTLHAVAFALLLSQAYPGWGWPLAIFALLVGCSRVVLGLHYPSDVVVGALIGLGTAGLYLWA